MGSHLHAGVAVIGAGIIGLATALRLADEGYDVLSIDAETQAISASAGNAGTVAAYNCVPIASPSVLRSLPHLLLSADSPFSMRWAALPSLAPWLIRFLRESLPHRARANASALAGLLRESLATWRELAEVAGAADLLRADGSLYVFPDQAAFVASAWERAQRAAGDVRQIIVSPADIAELEPRLVRARGPGVFFPDAAHLSDPATILGRLRLAAAARGARSIVARIDTLRFGAGNIRLDGHAVTIDADQAVIAAGAWSRPLARQAGDRIPLDTERGYHVEYGIDTSPLSRPVCAVPFGVYLTPMAGRLRAAGTVELGGLRRGPDPRRLAFLDRAARTLIADLPERQAQWLGFRPSLPDSLPVIGRAREDARVVYAFGHGHLGLTLAAVTARHVADLLREQGGLEAVRHFSPQRFR